MHNTLFVRRKSGPIHCPRTGLTAFAALNYTRLPERRGFFVPLSSTLDMLLINVAMATILVGRYSYVPKLLRFVVYQ